MNRPEMKVIRFKTSDVIATSGAVVPAAKTITLTKFGDGVASNGIVSFGGSDYTMDGQNSLNALIAALRGENIRNAGINYGTTAESLKSVMGLEYEREKGVNNNLFNGTYNYDPVATWKNSNGDTLKGVFVKQ